MTEKLKWCDGLHEHNGGEHNLLDAKLSGHHLHCPKCDKHLTSLLMCSDCGIRYRLLDALDAELKFKKAMQADRS